MALLLLLTATVIAEVVGEAWVYAPGASERELLESLKAQMEAFQGPFRRQSPRRDDDIDELSNQMVEAV